MIDWPGRALEALERCYFGRFLYAADWFIALLLCALLFLFLHAHASDVSDLLDKDGTALYAAFIGAFAALLGFAITSVSIIAGLVSAEPFRTLRRDEHYEDFWNAFLWSIRFLGLAVVVAVIAMFANHFKGQIWVFDIRWTTLFAIMTLVIACGSSLLRSGISFELVLAATRRAQRNHDDNPPRHACDPEAG
jgi:hypothetical protein